MVEIRVKPIVANRAQLRSTSRRAIGPPGDVGVLAMAVPDRTAIRPEA